MGTGHSGWFIFSSHGVTQSGGPWLFGRGTESWLLFTANILVTGIFYSLINAIPAAGEEFAGHGFLQYLFTQRFVMIKGIAGLGLIWSMRHLPDQLAAYNFPEHPFLGSFILSPIELISDSFFLGGLTFKSRSFISAAIAHGAGNSIQEGIIGNIHLNAPVLSLQLVRFIITVMFGFCFCGCQSVPQYKTALT